MWPKIGDLKVYTFVYLLGIAAHSVMARYWCRRLFIGRRIAVLFSVFYLFGMAVGARILYDLLENRFDVRNYLHLGYYFTDGLWGGPLAYLMLGAAYSLLLGGDRRILFDFMVLTLPIPMILAKAACFLNGCCYGVPCDWPWCLAAVEGAAAPPGIARHPTQLYEIVVLAVIATVFARLDRDYWRGRLVLWFVLLYGLGRPLTEVFRVHDVRRPQAGMVTASQAVCLGGALIAGAALLVSLRTRRIVGAQPPEVT